MSRHPAGFIPPAFPAQTCSSFLMKLIKLVRALIIEPCPLFNRHDGIVFARSDGILHRSIFNFHQPRINLLLFVPAPCSTLTLFALLFSLCKFGMDNRDQQIETDNIIREYDERTLHVTHISHSFISDERTGKSIKCSYISNKRGFI